MFVKIYTILIILLLCVCFSNISNNIDAQTNENVNHYKDPNAGISFEYPSDWRIASQEYANSMFGDSVSTTVKPVVVLFPESLSGASFAILSEILPFPVSIDQYYEMNARSILSDPLAKMGNAVPVTLGGLSGLKYNITFTDIPDLIQTQMFFIKDSKVFLIAHNTGLTEQSKDNADINSMIASLDLDHNNSESIQATNNNTGVLG